MQTVTNRTEVKMWRVALLCVFLWAYGDSNEQQCSSMQSPIFKFSVISKRNKTGHWVAQVSLNHDGNPDDEREWIIDVDHTTTKCKKSEMVQILATATTGRETVTPSKSNADYDYVPGLGYYRFHVDLRTWPVARETCARDGAYLLILNSKDEFAAVKKMWEKYIKTATYLHVGLTDHVTEGEFYSLLGEHVNLTGYANWANTEPNNGKTANCAAVGKDGFLEDSYCTNTFPFVCELL